MTTDAAGDLLICSARGCAQPARHVLLWNNPRIHTADRRKSWLACDDHEPTLRDHLSARGFWRETQPLDPSAADR